MDTSISQLTPLLNKQKINYSHGPTRWSRLTWPDDDAGVSDAKILFATDREQSFGHLKDGSWGWFRLIDQAKRSQTDAPETIKVVFTIGGRSAQFLIRPAVLSTHSSSRNWRVLVSEQPVNMEVSDDFPDFTENPSLGDFVSRRLPRHFVTPGKPGCARLSPTAVNSSAATGSTTT